MRATRCAKHSAPNSLEPCSRPRRRAREWRRSATVSPPSPPHAGRRWMSPFPTTRAVSCSGYVSAVRCATRSTAKPGSASKRTCRPISRRSSQRDERARSAPTDDDREALVVATFLPAAVVGANVVVAERRQHEMRERRAHAGLAVRDRLRLGSEPRVGVEVLELVGVLQHPVVAQRVLPEDVDRARDVAAARRPFLLAGELAVTPYVEEPGVAGAHRREDLVLRRDHTVAWMRNEFRRSDLRLASLERAAFGDPFLDAALHHGHLLVAVAA